MLERMGFTPEAAQLVTGDQGIDSVDELRNLDDDKASNLCRVLRRPGGTNAAGAADPGTKVSARAEDNLKLAIYYVKHQDRVSRAVNVGEITLTNVCKLIKQRDTERNHTDPDTPPMIDSKDWPKTMEAVEEYLRQFRGVNDVPLSYVVRIALAPKPVLTNPATNYLTLDEEMIARAPILVPGTAGVIADLEVNGPFTESFMTDRTTAWDKIAVLFQNHEAWTYAKPARRTRNGRAGFFGVYNHFLGPNNVDHMASKAERRLRDVNYHGEKRNWTFEKYHKSDAHEALSLLFQRDGVPPACIVDGSLEQVKGEFRRKLKEASCRLKQTEPYSPWQNAAEGNIRELKKGAGRKMIKSGSPKKLWDDCLVLESYIRSNTAHDIYMLHGEVPETIMSGETSDISQFCEFEWYEWVKFRDSAVQFPEDSLVLGRYLGPSIDVGPALTAKILKQNGEVVHRSTYRGLTPEEIVNPVDQAAMKSFNESIEVKLGPKASIDDFKDLGIDEPPILDRYEDDDLDGRMPDPPDEELDATPEVGDSYVNTEFADGEVTELTANAIAEAMFAQCDEDGNEYVLFDSFVDFRRDGTALSLADQKVVVKGRPSLRRTTVGWLLCCQWKDGSTSWEKLSDLKESHPVQTAEYAVAQGIDHEPAFNWRKARLVAGGHVTDVPPTITYSSVVGRETVRIALTLAALNDLEVKVADIMNAYVTAPTEEKIWTILGPEFGDQGKKAVIVRALYGLKSAGASFRHHLADCMKHLDYTPCLADPDLWMKPEVRPDDGVAYYAYILCYVDDILSIAHNAEDVLRRLDKYFMLKPGSLGDPDIYLGAKLKKMKLPNGVEAWAMSPARYVHQSVKNVEKYLEENLSARWKLPSKAENPFAIGYSPELDDSPELDPSLSSYYQSQIGILRWMVELGRIDMMTEVSMLASHLAMPREGHLEAIFHIYAYLKQKYNSRLAFDPTYPSIDMSDFKECDWKQFYGDVKEAIPPNAPEPRGKDVDLRMFVDSDHAGDKLTRRSRTGFMIFMNTALIDALSKKQATIETSVFGAEFVALKHGMERLRGLRYKLRMMGVSISGPSYIYGDN
eukprot:CCRYP_006074-RA/>CCRYP_006074-RA protein AED:0.29 eAED:0.04 QI:0/0/0/0.75/0.33/0.5/4/0/1079